MVKVIYIAGAARSGSTILARVLGEIEGFVSVGELYHLWGRGMVENRLCGCGEHFESCEVWRGRLSDASIPVDADRAKWMMKAMPRSRAMPLIRNPYSHRRFCRRYAEVAEHVGQLLTSLGQTRGSHAVIDSSKRPGYAYLLNCIDTVDLRVVHLVRDPRAAAYSWIRRKPAPDSPTGFMAAAGPARSSVRWTGRNYQAEQLRRMRPDRYIRVSYEDFVAAPRAALTEILSMVGEADRALPFVTENRVLLSSAHHVSGNPDRFSKGEVELRLDSEWVTEMRKRDKLVVNALTWPFLARYGYSI